MLTALSYNKEENPISYLKDHPVKVTALIYLKEMLTQENYEDCADTIAIAREFGATAGDIEACLKPAVKKKPVEEEKIPWVLQTRSFIDLM